MVVSCMFSSLIHFELIFELSEVKRVSFILLLVVLFSQNHLLKRLFFPHCIFLILLFLASLICSINLCVFFYASCKLF